MRLGPLEIRKDRWGAGIRLGRFGVSWLTREARESLKRRSYKGADFASYSDRMRGGSGSLAADVLIGRDGRKLRQVGNYLTRNSPQGAAIPRKRAFRASGALGPNPRVAAAGGEEIERRWKNWARNCTLDREQSWGQLCSMLLRCEDASGEAFASWSLEDGDLRLTPFEADQLATEWATVGGDGRTIRDGIEYDPRTGRKVAFWFRPFDPALPWNAGALSGSVRIEAERVVHLYERERPTQTRGVSLFAQIANSMADRGEARAAHLQVGKVAAYMGIFIHAETPANNFWGALNQEASDGTPAATDPDEIRLEPGSVNVLGPNERASFLNAKTPDLEFQQFDESLVREMAVHADMPAASLSGDYSGINYSSARMAARDHVMAEDYRRARFESQVANRVFRAWLQAQALSGAIRLAPARIEEVVESLSWAWPPRPYHDPLVEVRAEIAEIYVAKTKSWSSAVRARGLDPEQVAKEHAEDDELFKKYNLGALFGGSAESVKLGNTSPEDSEEAAHDAKPENNDGADEEEPAEEATA